MSCIFHSRTVEIRLWRLTETMVRSGAMDIIVVDSVAALVPKQEIEGDMGDSHGRTSGKTDVPGTP